MPGADTRTRSGRTLELAIDSLQADFGEVSRLLDAAGDLLLDLTGETGALNGTSSFCRQMANRLSGEVEKLEEHVAGLQRRFRDGVQKPQEFLDEEQSQAVSEARARMAEGVEEDAEAMVDLNGDGPR